MFNTLSKSIATICRLDNLICCICYERSKIYNKYDNQFYCSIKCRKQNYKQFVSDTIYLCKIKCIKCDKKANLYDDINELFYCDIKCVNVIEKSILDLSMSILSNN